MAGGSIWPLLPFHCVFPKTCFSERRWSIWLIMSAFFHFQHTVNRLFNNYTMLYRYKLVLPEIWRGGGGGGGGAGSRRGGQKKLPSKSPAYLGLRYLKLMLVLYNVPCLPNFFLGYRVLWYVTSTLSFYPYFKQHLFLFHQDATWYTTKFPTGLPSGLPFV